MTEDFLMNKTTPPRLSDRVPLLNLNGPNDNNIVMPLRMNDSTFWMLSDSETRLELDPEGLRVKRTLYSARPNKPSDYSGDLEPDGYSCTIGTAHSLFHQPTGDLISQMGCSHTTAFWKKDLVVVYRMRTSDPTRRIKIASFTPKSGVASYMHSFGLTDRLALFVEQPIVFDMNAMMLGKSMIDGMPVDYSTPTFFHVVPLDGGPIITKPAPFSFTFNHVANAFEVNGTLVVDIFEIFRSAHLMVGGAFDIWLNKTRRDTEINFEAIRFTIPFVHNSPVVARLNGLEYC